MFVNVIRSYRDVVAVCDSELLGKRFEEPFGKSVKQLDIKESFYKGKEGKKVSKEELLDIIKLFSVEDSTFNIVGEKSIQVALEAGTISKKEVGRIQGIPFALVLL